MGFATLSLHRTCGKKVDAEAVLDDMPPEEDPKTRGFFREVIP